MSSQTYKPLTIDGLRRSAAPQPLPPKRPRLKAFYPVRPTAKENKVWGKLQLPLLLVAGAFAGLFAETLAVGLSMLAIYGVVAFITRIPSRTTFTLALLLLAAISVMLLFKPAALLIGNFSTYAFVLLLIGVITLGKESRLPKRLPKRYKR